MCHAKIVRVICAVFFFFQAEDGIRDLTVTGVQTCALPVPDTEDPHVHEWRALDLSGAVPPEAFAGATVVVHAAVDTSGGYDGHQRNTIDATRNVLRGVHAAGATRLVHVGSPPGLRPPPH